jgi:hypothetical protein
MVVLVEVAISVVAAHSLRREVAVPVTPHTL